MPQQTVSQFLLAPLPTIGPINESVAPVPYHTVAGSPYPQSAVARMGTWARDISTPFQFLYNRSKNSQT